jgi:hypothetical protein
MLNGLMFHNLLAAFKNISIIEKQLSEYIYVTRCGYLKYVINLPNSTFPETRKAADKFRRLLG